MTYTHLRRLLWLGVAAVALPGLFRWLVMLENPDAFDFTGYYDAARRFASGERDLYTVTPPGNMPYVYPPLFAVLMQPFGLLSLAQAQDAWLLVNIACTVVAFWLVVKTVPRALSRREWLLLALAFVTFPPLFRTIRSGQVTCVLLLLLAVSAWAQRRARDPLAGTAYAVAASIKVFPAFYLLAVLAQGRKRVFVSGVLAGIALVAFSLAVAGWELHLSFVRDLLPGIAVTNILADAANQSFAGILHRWGIGNSLVLALVSAVLVIATLYLAYRAGPEADLLVMSLASVVALLISSRSWDFSYLILLVPLSLIYFTGLLTDAVVLAYGLITLERYFVILPDHWIFQAFGVLGALVLWVACARHILRNPAPATSRNA